MSVFFCPCGFEAETLEQIEAHVRDTHINKKEEDSDENKSDNNS